jgi:hexosaminidase
MKRMMLVAAVFGVSACVLDKRDAPPLAGPSVVQVANGAPVADFLIAPSVAVKNEQIVFDGSPSTDDGTIVSYFWTFSDGGSASGKQVTRSFSTAGNFGVTLRVTDDQGLTGVAAAQITVRDAALIAAFTVSPTDPIVGTTVNVNGLSSSALPGTTIVQYDWDFGDGGTGSGATSSHVYAVAQTFTIVLTIRDNAGRTASTSKTLQVK